MKLFWKKRPDTIDFTQMSDARVSMPKKQMKVSGGLVDLRNDAPANNSAPPKSSGSFMDFLSSNSSDLTSDSSGLNSNVITQVSEISELKQKLKNMTNRVEDLSNENYRLMQRIELLERKMERLGG